MIKVNHPLEKCNVSQQEFLANCPVNERRFHELMFTVGNASYRYHQEAKDYSPILKDYEEWLEGLPESISRDMRAQGFEACTSILSFTRYVMEKNDVGMEEYIRQLMDPEDYTEYREIIEKGSHEK